MFAIHTQNHPTPFTHLSPLRLIAATTPLSALVTAVLAASHYPHWALYGLGSLFGMLWLLSYALPAKALPISVGLSGVRILGFAILACWAGDFSVEKTTVVLIGCFSYKCVIVAFGAVSCGLALASHVLNQVNAISKP